MNAHVAVPPSPIAVKRPTGARTVPEIDPARLQDYGPAELLCWCQLYSSRPGTNARKVIYGRILNHVQKAARFKKLGMSFEEFLTSIDRPNALPGKSGRLTSRDYEFKQIGSIDLSDLPRRPITVRCLIAVHLHAPKGPDPAAVLVRRALFALAPSYKEDESPWLAEVSQEATALLHRAARSAEAQAQVQPVLARIQQVAAELPARRAAAADRRWIDKSERFIAKLEKLLDGLDQSDVIAILQRLEDQLQRTLERVRPMLPKSPAETNAP